MKTSELTGIALDWAVAHALQLKIEKPFEYSTEWRCGGPMIERHGIGIAPSAGGRWMASICVGGVEHLIRNGPTPLIAAMRCYVASKLGDEVEMPEALI